MAQSSRVTTIKERNTAWGNFPGPTVASIADSLLIIKWKDLVSTIGMMAAVMTESGKTVCNMARGTSCGLMDANM